LLVAQKRVFCAENKQKTTTQVPKLEKTQVTTGACVLVLTKMGARFFALVNAVMFFLASRASAEDNAAQIAKPPSESAKFRFDCNKNLEMYPPEGSCVEICEHGLASSSVPLGYRAFHAHACW
jgi:hypothetical protein